MIAIAPPSLCLPAISCPIGLPGVPSASGLGGDLASAAARAVLDAVNSAINSAADWLVGHVMDLIATSTAPDLSAGWFKGEVRLMEQVVVLVVLPLLMAATIGPVLRQDGRRLLRVWGVGLPLAVLAGAAGSQLAGLGLAATDQMCAVLTGSQAVQLAHQFTDAMSSRLVSGAPVFVQMVLALLTVLGTVLVWLELMVRAAAVYVATFFMPLALVAYVWPATAGAAKRAIEILVSLILSKFVIVASLTLGLAAIASSGVDASMAGAAILLLAGFAPFALMRLAPVVEASAIAHLEGMSRRPGRAAGRAVTAAAAARTHPVTALLMSAKGGSAGSPASRPVTATSVAERPPDFRVGSQAAGRPTEAGDG